MKSYGQTSLIRTNLVEKSAPHAVWGPIGRRILQDHPPSDASPQELVRSLTSPGPNNRSWMRSTRADGSISRQVPRNRL
eukprot:5138316-Pyramimonas_sp.AAC.1